MNNNAIPVFLKVMDDEAFCHYLEIAIPAYADDNISSGRWEASDALERSKQSYTDLLPQRHETKNNSLFNIIVSGRQETVGHIWIKIEDHTHTKSAFIYDIEIYKVHRRNGYAKAALSCIESVVAEMGASSLGLHVFNNNPGAINLYESIGFQAVSQNMQKKIEPVEAS